MPYSIRSNLAKIGWHTVHALTGVHLSTPNQYLDWSMMSATFPADPQRVKQRLPSENLKPAQSTQGASVTFRAMEVRNAVGLPPYNEFAVEVPVVYESVGGTKALPGAFILYMPVTREEARWGGVEVYGLPKFIAEISFDDIGEATRCNVRAEGKNIITLEVKTLTAEPTSWDWYIYGVRDAKLLRSRLRTDGQRGVTSTLGGATFALGDHPVADELRALGIDGMSVAHEYGPKLRTVESNPVIIASLKQ